MITDVKDINALIIEADRHVCAKIDLHLISGGALMVRTMKLQTKDMDFIVRTRKEYDIFRRYLTDCGFVSQKSGVGYEHRSLSQMSVKGDVRTNMS